ncbi:hypothetical protein PR048_024026 [Dryococelus australis]|uniref:Uncharacterized protein n=1 Tax=Dryococelus australis TaxID=614101 RepID=A0ABQ9GVR1_9NEOP|nr:hypothetical protein PR048_024026 [Dryococelus australis]
MLGLHSSIVYKVLNFQHHSHNVEDPVFAIEDIKFVPSPLKITIEEIWAALHIEVLRADEGEMRASGKVGSNREWTVGASSAVDQRCVWLDDAGPRPTRSCQADGEDGACLRRNESPSRAVKSSDKSSKIFREREKKKMGSRCYSCLVVLVAVVAAGMYLLRLFSIASSHFSWRSDPPGPGGKESTCTRARASEFSSLLFDVQITFHVDYDLHVRYLRALSSRKLIRYSGLPRLPRENRYPVLGILPCFEFFGDGPERSANERE